VSTALPERLDAEILENLVENGPNRRLRLAVGDAWPASEPGQFVMLSPGSLPAAPRFDPLLPRPMAVFRREGGALDVLYKVTGRGTALLAAARPGERIRVVGPLGHGFPLPEPGERAVLVGGGTGIASLYDLAARASARGPVTALLGAQTADALMAVDAFGALGVELGIATEDGSRGHRGRVTELLGPALAGRARVYACGPTPMMRAAAEQAERAGRPCLVSLENRMACGFGVCLGCAVPRRGGGGFGLVCKEGPVFPSAGLALEALP
jgi:dihydroorotate dehydrogenase electron transfer subunit